MRGCVGGHGAAGRKRNVSSPSTMSKDEDPPRWAREAVGRIVSEELGASLRSISAVGGGYSGGNVCLARVGRPGAAAVVVMVKLMKAAEGASPETDLEARIYGKAGSDLATVHALLGARGLPTYELLARGGPGDGIPCAWMVMSVLPGVSVRGHSGEPEANGFSRMCGEALGATHSVTRAFDGAAERTVPFATSWTEAFFESLEQSLGALMARAGEVVGRHEREVRAFIDERRRRWVAPREYVLSHLDGLQGHAVFEAGQWQFAGHVDIEDFGFTDARFPLAGYELGAAGEVGPEFWDGYYAWRPPDPSFEDARQVFKLYYTIGWSWMDFSPRYNATVEARAANLERRAGNILRTIRHLR